MNRKSLVPSLALGALTLTALLTAPAPPLFSQQVEHYHLDALGSVRAVTDASGAIVTRHDYYPYGEEWNEPPSVDDQYGRKLGNNDYRANPHYHTSPPTGPKRHSSPRPGLHPLTPKKNYWGLRIT